MPLNGCVGHLDGQGVTRTRAASRGPRQGAGRPERAVPQPPCGLRPGPREAALVRGESSGRLPWVEVGQQFLASIEAEPEQLVGRGVFFP
jgi:hypothetical protein